MSKTTIRLLLIFIVQFIFINCVSAQDAKKNYQIEIDSSQLILNNFLNIEIFTEFNDIEIDLETNESFEFRGIKIDSTSQTSKITKTSNHQNSNRFTKIARFEIKKAGRLSLPSIKIITPSKTFKTEIQELTVMTIEDYKNRTNSFPFINNEGHPEIEKGILSEFIMTNNDGINNKDTLSGSLRIYTRFSNQIVNYGVEQSNDKLDIILLDKEAIVNSVTTINGKEYQSFDILFLQLIPHTDSNKISNNLNLKSLIKIPFRKRRGLFHDLTGPHYANYINLAIVTEKIIEVNKL